MMRASVEIEISGWRQGNHLLKKLKKLLRQIESMRKSVRNGKGKSREKLQKKFKKLHRKYLSLTKHLVGRAQESLATGLFSKISTVFQLENYIEHALRQIDQIERRIFQG